MKSKSFVLEAVRSALMVFAGMALTIGMTTVAAQTSNPPSGNNPTPNFNGANLTGDLDVTGASSFHGDVTIEDNTMIGSSRNSTTIIDGNATFKSIPPGTKLEENKFTFDGDTDFNNIVDFTDATVIGLDMGGEYGSDPTFNTITVTNGGNFSGGTVDFNNTVDFTDATVIGLETGGGGDCTTDCTFDSVTANDWILVEGDIETTTAGKIQTGDEANWDFTDILGYSPTAADIVSTNDVFVDNALFNDGWIMGGRYIITTAASAGGAPGTYSDGDIAATDDLWADDDIVADIGSITTGSPTAGYTSGDIAATDDLWADDDIFALGSIGYFYQSYDVETETLTSKGDGNHAIVWAETSCNSGDIVIACGGRITNNTTTPGETPHTLMGNKKMDDDTCRTYALDSEDASSAVDIVPYAYCFSADGA